MNSQGTIPRTEQIERVADQLLPSAARLVRLLVRQVRSSEVSRTEIEVLSTLTRGPLSISELTELEGTAQPTMTLLVKRLEAKGWVEREGLAEDRRVVIVRLTESGSEAQARLRAVFTAALAADLQPLGDEQLEALDAATEALGTFVDELQRRASR
jgi:DNA-binding MarR family transcriptional regulator